MPSLDRHLHKELEKIHLVGNYRRLVPTTQKGVHIIRKGKSLISFSGNDYLGLSSHPEVLAAMNATHAGAGASRFITGNDPHYEVLEKQIARLKHAEAALVFGSGYMANIGVLAALIQTDDIVLIDKLAHACMYDGVCLSGAKMQRFRHNDSEHLKELLEKHRPNHKHAWIVTETIFSMDGDAAPLVPFRNLANIHDAWLVTDDAHGILLQETLGKPDVQIGTLSKAVGVYGGYVAGSRKVIDYLTNTCRTALFSTALPPGIIQSILTALRIAEQEAWRKSAVLSYAKSFANALNLPKPAAAIVPVILGTSERVIKASEKLMEQGLYIAAIRSPTVPKNTARLRVTFSASHQPEHIAGLIEAMRAL